MAAKKTTKEPFNTSSKVKKETTMTNNSNMSNFWWIGIVLSFVFGISVSILNLEQLSLMMDPYLSNLLSYTSNIGAFHRNLNNDVNNSNNSTIKKLFDVDRCYATIESAILDNNKITWDQIHPVTIVMHRNGQAESCGDSSNNGSNTDDIEVGFHPVALAIRTVLQGLNELGQPCPKSNNKYHVESFLTRLLRQLLPPSSCASEEMKKVQDYQLGLFDYCDMGEEKTPILLDHQKLVPNIIKSESSSSIITKLPCHFHTEHGVRVTSLQQFGQLLFSRRGQDDHVNGSNTDKNCIVTPDGENVCPGNEDANDKMIDMADIPDTPTTGTILSNQDGSRKELHLYAVPAGRVFMHVAAYIGQIIELEHVRGADPTKRVYLEVLSVSPAVFDLHNFFTKDESAELVQRALAETKESHRIKRSTTGTGEHHVNNRRTSESGFDTDGATSIKIKQRCFDVLGFDEYIESHGDGLQILRYNQTTAYIPHMDYLDIDKRLEHDYDSSKKGGNRFATILLYMTDLGEKDGGETVFIDAWPTNQPEEERKPIETALRELRESDQHGILEEGSWQEKMVAQCRSRLAIRPDSARAVLFYSQLPNGQPDNKSKHGGCPVLSGVKYAANLWVWNTPRDGYPGNPKNPDYKSSNDNKKKKEEGVPPGRVTAKFRNSGKDQRLLNAKLYFYDGATDKEWGSLGFGEELSIYTYKTHVWKVMVGENVYHTYTIENDQPPEQEFAV